MRKAIDGASRSENKDPDEFYLPRWKDGFLSDGFQLLNGDCVVDRQKWTKFEIVNIRRGYSKLTALAFRIVGKPYQREEMNWDLAAIAAAIEILEYSVWRNGKKVWPSNLTGSLSVTDSPSQESICALEDESA